jgi:hypothetical protein
LPLSSRRIRWAPDDFLGGRASYQIWAEVRNRGAQQLAVTFPPGFEPVGGSRDGDPVTPGWAGPSPVGEARRGHGISWVGSSPVGEARRGHGISWAGSSPVGEVRRGHGIDSALAIPLASGEGTQVVHLYGLLPLAVPAAGDFALPLPALSAPAARVEVRFTLPGEQRCTLVDAATRAHPAGLPPGFAEKIEQRNTILNSNVIAQQMLAAPGALSAPPAAAFFPVPPGFATVEAAWSALSADPAPLAFRIKSDKEDTPWF